MRPLPRGSLQVLPGKLPRAGATTRFDPRRAMQRLSRRPQRPPGVRRGLHGVEGTQDRDLPAVSPGGTRQLCGLHRACQSSQARSEPVAFRRVDVLCDHHVLHLHLLRPAFDLLVDSILDRAAQERARGARARRREGLRPLPAAAARDARPGDHQLHGPDDHGPAPEIQRSAVGAHHHAGRRWSRDRRRSAPYLRLRDARVRLHPRGERGSLGLAEHDAAKARLVVRAGFNAAALEGCRGHDRDDQVVLRARPAAPFRSLDVLGEVRLLGGRRRHP